jgi:hypothetical protein
MISAPLTFMVMLPFFALGGRCGAGSENRKPRWPRANRVSFSVSIPLPRAAATRSYYYDYRLYYAGVERHDSLRIAARARLSIGGSLAGCGASAFPGGSSREA